MLLIEDYETREEIWLSAIDYLLNNCADHEDLNLILRVKSPMESNARSDQIREKFSEMLREANLFPLHTVAETIFPASEFKKHGKKGVYDTYPEDVFPKIKQFRGNGRGTYAYRLVRGLDPKNKCINPLENMIERMRAQLARNGGIKCAYELPISRVEHIPINRNDNSLMGFPCLSHLSFKLDHDREKLYLTAIYRSHDYIQKALGNMLGLVRLQSFVASELNLRVGELVCHSTLARLDTHPGLGIQKIKCLLEECGQNAR